MTKKFVKKALDIYGIALGVLTVVVGVLFIAKACSIYFSDEKVYTYEIVAEKFSQIAAFAYVWLAAVVVGGVGKLVIDCVAPSEKKISAYQNPSATLARLSLRLGESEQRKRFQNLRLWVWIASALVCVGGGVAALIVLLKKSYNPQLVVNAMASRLLTGLPWVIGALCVVAGAVVLEAYCLKKEIKLAKSELAENAKQGLKPQAKEQKKTWKEKVYEKAPFLQSQKFVWGVRVCVCAIGLALVVVGICNGGMNAVLRKAIAICTQCIGLG